VAAGTNRRQVPAGLARAPAAVAQDLSTGMIAAPACPGAPGSGELTLEARVVQGGGRVSLYIACIAGVVVGGVSAVGVGDFVHHLLQENG